MCWEGGGVRQSGEAVLEGGGGCAGQARLVRPPGGAPIRRGRQATMWGERCAGQAIMCIVRISYHSS